MLLRPRHLNTSTGDSVGKRIQKRMWRVCNAEMIGSKLWSYIRFTPEASRYIPSLQWENMGAREWEGDWGREALKITVPPSSPVSGAPSAAQKKTLVLSSNLRHFLSSSPSLPPALSLNLREDGRRSRGWWHFFFFSPHVPHIPFIPISLELLQSTWHRRGTGDRQWAMGKSTAMRDAGRVDEKGESENNKEMVDERWGSEREGA